MTRWRRGPRAAARTARVWGRRLGLLPYEPERWTVEQWNAAYDAGHLGYYGGLDELARYSVVVGYVGWFGSAVGGTQPRVLDVGCGIGLLRRRLEGAPFSEYVGVDLSTRAIEAAESQGFAKSRFVVGDISTLELGGFDIVVLNEVLYYVCDASAFLDQVKPLLGGQSLLVVSMWRHAGDRALWRTADSKFPIVDRVEVRNRANSVNPRGWLIACYHGGTVEAPQASAFPDLSRES